MRDEGGVRQGVDRRAVVDRVLADLEMAVRNDVDNGLVPVSDDVAAGDRAGTDILVLQALLAVHGDAVDPVDRAAVVEEGNAAAGEVMAAGDQLDHAGVVVVYVQTAGAVVLRVDVRVGQRVDRSEVVDTVVVGIDALRLIKLQEVIRLARDGQDTGGVVADNGGAIGAGGVADGVRGDHAAADAVGDRQGAGVHDRRHALPGRGRRGRAGLELEGAAVELQIHGVVVDQLALGVVAVQVEGDRGARGDAQGSGAVLVLIAVAVGQHGDGVGLVVEQSVKRFFQRGVILCRAALRHGGDITGIEAVDVDRSLRDLPLGHRAGEHGSRRVISQTPGDLVVVGRADAHGGVGRRGQGRAEGQIPVSGLDDIIGRIAHRDSIAQGIPGKALVQAVVLRVQDKVGPIFLRRTGDGHDAVRRDAGDADGLAADAGRADTGGRAQVGQTGDRVAGGAVEGIIGENGVAAVFVINGELIPLIRRRGVPEGTRSAAAVAGLDVLFVSPPIGLAVPELGRGEINIFICCFTRCKSRAFGINTDTQCIITIGSLNDRLAGPVPAIDICALRGCIEIAVCDLQKTVHVDLRAAGGSMRRRCARRRRVYDRFHLGCNIFTKVLTGIPIINVPYKQSFAVIQSECRALINRHLRVWQKNRMTGNGSIT